MAKDEKDTTVISTGSSGASWFLIGALLVIVAGGLYFFLGGDLNGSKDVNIKLEVPSTSSN